MLRPVKIHQDVDGERLGLLAHQFHVAQRTHGLREPEVFFELNETVTTK